MASPFCVRPAWAQSNGCKSRMRVSSAKHIANGKGVHRKVESEGSRRQTSGLTNRNHMRQYRLGKVAQQTKALNYSKIYVVYGMTYIKQ